MSTVRRRVTNSASTTDQPSDANTAWLAQLNVPKRTFDWFAMERCRFDAERQRQASAVDCGDLGRSGFLASSVRP
jgi:hypothetical protein